MSSDGQIKKICGDKIGNFDLENIGNDPNFVFTNDPNFETLVLYGPDNKIINVNSWIECANYVNGGWSSSILQNTNYEKYYFYFIALFSIGIFVFTFLRSNYVKK